MRVSRCICIRRVNFGLFCIRIIRHAGKFEFSGTLVGFAIIRHAVRSEVPRGCVNLQHEVELGIVISKKATDISENQAMDFVAGYVLALDMTARDFQNKAKEEGNPWIFAKGFDTSCPISKFIDKDKIADPHNLNLWCKVNGQMRQDGNTKDMMFKIPFIISYISSYFTLEPCDVVLTGTPKGVSGVKPGDKIECGLDNLVVMTYSVESNFM
uniref:oxaloacetate tautomerase n=1 Tax=Strigamia maritima TaxID=126957 RepID=T1J8U2_STRMM